MTEKLITVLTFNYPHELAVIRGRLEAGGIECFVQDELTVQVNPFYSNAIGGVKLQVKEYDLENTIKILKDGGYLEDSELQPPKSFIKLDNFTSRIPFVNKLPLLFRLIILIAAAISLMVLIVFYTTLPTTYEILTEHNWCVDYVVYNGKNYLPQTKASVKMTGPGICDESITFRKNGTVTMPGFKSGSIWGNWKLENNSLQIFRADTFDFVYNGLYEIDYSKAGMKLQSAKTTLYCHAENLHFNFPF